MRFPKLPARREDAETSQHEPVVPGSTEPSAQPGYRETSLPSMPPPPLTSELTRSIRFTISEPQGYYFEQVENFVQQVIDALAYYENAEFQYRQAMYDLQVELDQQTYDVQRLRSEIELFKVQGSPLVNPDGSYVTESQKASDEGLAAALEEATVEIARLQGLSAAQDQEIASLRQWGDQVAEDFQALRDEIAGLRQENEDLRAAAASAAEHQAHEVPIVALDEVTVNGVEGVEHDEDDLSGFPSDVPVPIPIPVAIPVPVPLPEIAYPAVVPLISEPVMPSQSQPEPEPVHEPQPEPVYEPEPEPEPVYEPEPEPEPVYEPEPEPEVVYDPEVIEHVSSPGTFYDPDTVYDPEVDAKSGVEDDPQPEVASALEAVYDPEEQPEATDTPVVDHEPTPEAASEPAYAPEGADDSEASAEAMPEANETVETDEFVEEPGRSVPVVPVDSELPEGAELPGTGEAAITYPPAAPGIPLDTRGVPVDVWAPELNERLRAAAEGKTAEPTPNPDA